MQKLPKLLVMVHEKGINISDRRKGKILKIIAANALVSGRTYVTEEDLLILKNILAGTPDEYNTISTILTETLQTPEKYLHELIEIDNNLMEIQKRLNELNTNSMSSTPILTDLLRSLRATHERVQKMAQDISNEAVNKKANETLQLINSLLEQIAKMLGIIT